MAWYGRRRIVCAQFVEFQNRQTVFVSVLGKNIWLTWIPCEKAKNKRTNSSALPQPLKTDCFYLQKQS